MVKPPIPFQGVTMTGAMHWTSWIGVVLTLAATAWLGASVQGEPEIQDLARQRDKQKDIRADTDHVVRRTGTMLRVLDYYKLDRSAEKRLLDEVAGTLAGLSKEQMADVIARLEKATRISNQKEVLTEVDRAYDQH